MANTVLKVLRTSTAGKQPNTTNAANLQYIDAGELALNMADKILYTSNGSALIAIGANQVNQNITGNLTLATTSGISANGSYGTAGQVLTTNATSVYWSTVSSGSSSLTVRSTNGDGGTINVAVGSVTAINFDESTGIHVKDQGSGNVFVSLGSGYKYITVAGQQTITAVGEDTLNVANAQGIYLTTTNTAPKTLTIGINVDSQFTWSNTQTFSNTITFNSNTNYGAIAATSGTVVSNNKIVIGNNSVNSSINSTAFTGTSNNTSYVGSVTAANVVSNAQLSGNLSNYQTTAGLSANVATLTSNNTSYVGSVTAANVVSNAQLSGNLSNYQTTAGLSANVATLTANNTSFVGTVSAANVVSNTQLSSNLANYFNLTGSYTLSNTQTFSNNITFGNSTVNVVSNSSILQMSNGTAQYSAMLLPRSSVGSLFTLGIDTTVGQGPGGSTIYFPQGDFPLSWNIFTVNTSLMQMGNSTNYVNFSTGAIQFTIPSASGGGITVNNSGFYAGNNSNVVANTTGFYINGSEKYLTTAGLASNVATLTANNTSFVGSVSAANVVSNAQLSGNLSNYQTTAGMSSYQTTAGLSANVATLTANNTSYVGSVTAVNVVSNAQLSGNLSNYQTTAGMSSYQTTAGLSANVATLAANNASYLGTIAAANYVQNTDSRTLSGNLNFTGANNTFGTMYTVGAVPGAVTNSVSANTTTILFGNSSVFATANSTIFSGTSLTANNASYLGGTAASGYQTTAGLSANVATLSSNNASYLGGTIASGYQTTAGLSANVATLTANAAGYLGTVAAANYVQNTDSRTLSGNINFTGTNTYFSGKATHNANLVLNPGISVIDSTGSQGTAGQILSSNGSGNVYWASAGAASVNQAAQYAWTNTQTFSNTITFSSSILANTINAASYSVGTLFTANSTLVNAAAINITGQVNAATLYATTSANVGTAFVANTIGAYHTGTMNAASYTVGTTFTANSTLVNAAAINITGQTNTATFYATTTANVGTLLRANTSAYLVAANSTVNTIITATSITQANTTATPFIANATGIYHTGAVNAASVSATNATFQGINLTSNTSTLFSTYSTSFSTSSVNAGWPTPNLPSAGNGYTVEFFVKFSSLGSTQVAYSDNGIAGLGFYANTSAIQIADQGYSADTLSGLSLQNGVWYHIAFIGRNNFQYIAINGVVQQIGTGPGGHSSSGTWGGWGSLRGPATFSNFRIVTGSQVYSLSGFAVPSAPLTPISGTYVLTLQDATFIDNSGSSRSITTTGSPTMATDSISISLTSASTVGTLNNGNLTIPVITPTYIYANSVTGTSGQVLTSNSAGGLYWATPAAATNVAAQYTWTNTQTFSNTITFSNNILVGANVSLNTSYISVGNSTYNTYSNSSYIVVANNTGSANLTATSLAIGSAIINSAGFGAGANVYGNTTTLFVGNTTVNSSVNSTMIQVSNSTVSANHSPNGLITGNTVANTTVLQANTVIARGSANVDVQLNIGANVIGNTSTLSVANATGNTTIAALNVTVQNSTVNSVMSLQSLIIQANTTVNGTISSTQTYIANSTGNSIIVPTSITVQNSTVNSVMSLQSLIIQANTTVNSSHTATLLQVSNSTFTANLTAADLKIGAATVVNSSVVNASSHTVGTNFIANTTQLTITVPFSANGGVGTAGQVLTSNGATGSPYWATASGGSVNTANQYVFSNTITFSANQTLFTSSNASPNAIAGAIVANGGIAANGNIYTAGRIGYANSAGANQAYTYYNASTTSLDTVFG